MTVLHAWSIESRRKLKGDGYCYIIKPYRNVCVGLNEKRYVIFIRKNMRGSSFYKPKLHCLTDSLFKSYSINTYSVFLRLKK